MKKNEKGFRQEDKNLEMVSGGAMSGIETEVETGDIMIGYGKTENHDIKNSNNNDYHKQANLRDINIGGNLSF